MPLTPEQKRQAQEILKLAPTEEDRQKFIVGLKSKGVTEMDLPELATPKSEGFSFGGAIGALGSGGVEGFTGLTPEQIQNKPQAQSGLNVNLPFLGQVDPVRAAGQVVGSIYSPYNKIKIAGKIGWILRNLGPSVASAIQDVTDPNTGEVNYADVIRLLGADMAGALIGKGIEAAPIANKAIGRMGQNATPTTPKPGVDPEIESFIRQQDAQQMGSVLEDELMGRNIKLLPEHALIPMPEKMQRPIRLPETQQGMMPGTSNPSFQGPIPGAPKNTAEFLAQQQAAKLSNAPPVPGAPRNTAEYLAQQQASMPSQISQLPPTKDLPSREQEALRRIQTKPKTETRKPAEAPKQKTVSSNSLNVGDQYVSPDGRLMEVVEKPSVPKKATSKQKSDYDLVVRDILTGKKSKLNRTKEVSKISDIQLENLDFLFGEK